MPSHVSVIIPTYNRAQFITTAIESVIAQNYDNLEIVVVDDGSTDSTIEILSKFQEKEPRITSIKLPENKGIGFSRDVGIRNATGEYIGFVDSDDYWLPQKLDIQVSILDNHPNIDFLFSDFWNVDYSTQRGSRGFDKAKLGISLLETRNISDGLKVIEGGFEIGILRKDFVQLGTMMFRARMLDKIGGFEHTLFGAEDLEFCWRAAILGARFAYLDQILVERQQNEMGLTSNPIISWFNVLQALKICRKNCYRYNRLDLVDVVRKTEQRAWRNIMVEFGKKRKSGQVFNAFAHSLSSGFSIKNLIYLTLSLSGPQVLANLKELRRLMELSEVQ